MVVDKMFIWYKFPWETPQEPPVRGFNFLLFAFFFLILRRQSCLLTHLVSLYPGDLCADIAAINRDAAYSIAWVWLLQIRTWIESLDTQCHCWLFIGAHSLWICNWGVGCWRVCSGNIVLVLEDLSLVGRCLSIRKGKTNKTENKQISKNL